MVPVLLIVLACVATVGGILPQNCCLNNQWHGTMMEVGAEKTATGQPVIQDDVYYIDFDFDEKVMAVSGTTLHPLTGPHKITVLDNFKTGSRYVVYDGNCTVPHIPHDVMNPPCIHPNLTYETSLRFGEGSNQLSMDTFGGQLMGATVRFSVTRDCTPVTYTEHRQTPGNAYVYSYVFADVVQGHLRSADPFVVPNHCHRTTEYPYYFGFEPRWGAVIQH